MRLGIVAITAACLLCLGACSEGDAGTDPASPAPTSSPTESAEPSDPPSAEPSPSETETESAQVLEITFEGDSVTPNGERVEVTAGEPVDFRITADAPGSIHVHSTPEEEIAYGEGRTRVQITFERPGVVEVESHDLGLVIVQLEVRP